MQAIRYADVAGLALIWWTFTTPEVQARVLAMGGVLCVVTDPRGFICVIEDEL